VTKDAPQGMQGI